MPDAPLARRLALPDSPLAARVARRAVSDLLALCGCGGDSAHTATLLTSEVVANAIQHADPHNRGERRFLLQLRVSAGVLRVAVHDPDPCVPARPTAGEFAEHGRGLMLLAALAKEWGVIVSRAGAGKSTWFTLALN